MRFIRDILLFLSFVLNSMVMIILLTYTLINDFEKIYNDKNNGFIVFIIMLAAFSTMILYYFYHFKATIITDKNIIVKRRFYKTSKTYSISNLASWDEAGNATFRFNNDKFILLYSNENVLIGEINSFYNKGFNALVKYLEDNFNKRKKVDLNYSH